MKVRKACSEDKELILELIKELADYEREPDAVKTRIEDIERHGFGDSPIFHCLIGEVDGRPQGFAVYFFTWSTWEGKPTLYLEDLFVRPSSRGGGLGLRLLRELAKLAVDKDCARMEWSVLDWNQSAIDFYDKLGAFHKKDWLPFRFERSEFERFANSC